MNILTIIILFNLFYLTLSQSSGCIGKWYAVVKERMNVTTDVVTSQLKMKNYCYQHIDNYKTIIEGIETQRECYLYHKFNHFKSSGITINRCGQCLEITGPTQQPYICVITGFFDGVENTPLTSDDLSRVVVIENNHFNYLSSEVHASRNHGIEVTTRVVSCDYDIKPKLYTISTRVVTEPSRQFLSIVQPINMNTLVKIILINKEKYFIREDGTFEIPAMSNFHLQLVSVNNHKINFKNVTSTRSKKIFVANSQFPEDRKNVECVVIAERILFRKDAFPKESMTNVHDLFTWDFYQIHSDGLGSTRQQSYGVDAITYDNSLKHVNCLIFYPTVSRIGKFFKHGVLYFTGDNSNFKLENFTIMISDYNGIAKEIDTVICHLDLQRIDYFNQNKTIIYKIGFKNKKCFSYGNILNYYVTTGPDTNLKLYNAELILKTSETISCDQNVFKCIDRECTYSNDTCVPNCGVCDIGYKCSQEGKCVSL